MALKNGQLCSSADDRTIRFWNVQTLHCEQVLTIANTCKMALEAVDVTIILGFCEAIELLDCQNKKTIATIKFKEENSEESTCNCMAFVSTDAIACGIGKKIKELDIKTQILSSQQLTGHSSRVSDLLFLSGQNMLYSSSHDNSIKIWSYSARVCLRTLEGHTSPVYCIKWWRKGFIVSGSSDNSIGFWNIDTGLHIKSIQTTIGTVYSVDKTKNGTVLACGGTNSSIAICF